MFGIRPVKKTADELEKILDSIEYQNSWRRRMKRNFLHNMNEEKALFVARCMSENLSHARHVENERITFNSVFMAMTAGAMAFAATTDNHVTVGGLIIGMIISCFIAWTLTVRWSNSFERHLHYAKECYIILYKYYFRPYNKRRKKLSSNKKFSRNHSTWKELKPPKETSFEPEDEDGKIIWEQAIKEKIGGLRDYPLYCFKIRNPIINFEKPFAKSKRFIITKYKNLITEAENPGTKAKGSNKSYDKVFYANTKRLYNQFYFVVMGMLIYAAFYSLFIA